jgi:hypothetical protein
MSKKKVDAADVEEEITPKKRTRNTCYEKSCTRKPTEKMTFKLGKKVWKKKFCKRCADRVEVLGWERE